MLPAGSQQFRKICPVFRLGKQVGWTSDFQRCMPVKVFIVQQFPAKPFKDVTDGKCHECL
jgi:hypothetical protein